MKFTSVFLMIIISASVVSIAQTESVNQIDHEYQNAKEIDSKKARSIYELTSVNGFIGLESTCILFEANDGTWWYRYVEKNQKNLTFQTSLIRVERKVINNIDFSSHPQSLPANSLPSEGKCTYRYYTVDKNGRIGRWEIIHNPHPVIQKLESGKDSPIGFFRKMLIENQRKNTKIKHENEE